MILFKLLIRNKKKFVQVVEGTDTIALLLRNFQADD